jgi:hypothetical protein
MNYTLKEYQIKKTKKYFKNNSIFFFFNFSKLKPKEWLKIEQQLKQLKLTQYKILNGITTKVFYDSTFKNYSNLITGLITLVKPNFKNIELKLNELTKKLSTLFALLSLKLNTKIYLATQLLKIKILSYEKNMLQLHKTLEKSTKTFYVLTFKSK